MSLLLLLLLLLLLQASPLEGYAGS